MREIKILTALVSLGALIFANIGSAQAAPDAEEVSSAMVYIHSTYTWGMGVRISDERTVLAPIFGWLDTGRDFYVHPAVGDHPEVEAEVSIFEGEAQTILKLDLREPLPGGFLHVCEGVDVEIGDRVYFPVCPSGWCHDEGWELMESSIDAFSESMLILPVAFVDHVKLGVPVLHEDGCVLALMSSYDGTAIRTGAALNPEFYEPRGMSVLPIIGFHFGAGIGGFLEGAFVMTIDVGVALWDQLAFVLRFQMGLGEESPVHVVSDDLGVGSVPRMNYDVSIGLETRYRLMLFEVEGSPLYLDFAAGVMYQASMSEATGTAVFSGDPGCNPYEEPCPIMLDESSHNHTREGVGPTFGADLRFFGLNLGYRFVPGAISYQIPDTHYITFGVSFF